MSQTLTVPNVDVELLRKQRDAVNELANEEDVLPGAYFDELNGLLCLLDAMVDIANEHEWECISPGLYDSTYECQRCGQKHDESIDDLSTMKPTHGCTGNKND